MAGVAPFRAPSSRRVAEPPKPEPRPKDAVNAAAGERDAVFPRTVRKVYKAVTSDTRATQLLRIPWGPRLSVLFDPRGATNIGGGTVTVYAIIEADQFVAQEVTIPVAGPMPVILVEAGCDSFLVTATLGTPLAAGETQAVECFVYASTYAGSL